MRKSKKFMLGIMMMGMVVSQTLPTGIPVISGQHTVYAETITSQGKCGDNALFKYDKDTETLTISGTGNMWDDYGFANGLDATKKILIENGITTIGAGSFNQLYQVKEVSIPESVTTIKENAFCDIHGMVEIPKSVIKVESYAFAGAEKYIIKGDVKGYDYYAFSSWSDIGDIVLYGAAQDLGKALYGTIPKKITIAQENESCRVDIGCILSVGGKELYYCMNPKSDVKIPDTVERIAPAAFYGQNIKKLTLGKNLKTIGDFAFENSRIKNVETNSRLADIGNRAFYGTKIKNISFNGKVKLGLFAFHSKAKVQYLKKFKDSQTSLTSANVGKKTYSIRYAKVSGAKGYQIRIKKGKKKYNYYTTKNTYTKKAPKALTKEYRVTKDYESLTDYFTNPKGSAVVTVRPYKVVKGKKVYGRWSKGMVLSYRR